ncbi:MAG TPA: ABC transporter permease [Magnetospirillaceae bacterium]|nr:ABC transporter permease [Magnetospirillaceae bacterium]
MKAGAVLFLAGRNILGRKSGERDLARRTLSGAVLSVAISMVPLLVTLVVADGMIQGITSRYVELSSYHIQCIPFAGQGEAGIADALNTIRRVPGVRGAWAETLAVGVAFSRGARSGAVVRAIDPDFLADPGTRAYLSVLEGEPALSGPNDVLLGSELARELEVRPGGTVNLLSVRSRRDGSVIPRVTVFRVKGVVSSGYRDLDSRWFLVPRETAGRFIAPDVSRTVLGVKVDDPFDSLEPVLDGLRAVLPQGWGIVPWMETERNLYRSLRTTRYLLLLIMGLTVVVAAVNISSALVTLVIERAGEIAILKGLGASPADIGKVFVAGGLLMGLAGSTLGLVLGVLAAVHINELIAGIEIGLSVLAAAVNFLAGPFVAQGREIFPATFRILNPDYYLEHIPVVLDYQALAAVFCSALILSCLASVLPARKAAALPPLEILRRR